jgi:hypothetical protein
MSDCLMREVWHDAQLDLVERLRKTHFGNRIAKKSALAQ